MFALAGKHEEDAEERAQPSETSFFYELLFGSLRFDPPVTSSSSLDCLAEARASCAAIPVVLREPTIGIEDRRW